LAAAFSAQVAQQEKVKDDLMRAKDELETLKKQFETQRADSNKLTKRVEASRETIISLLIDQSRIKRKQVSVFYFLNKKINYAE
jgi:uncharacterized membrane-anchored protein YhcB (DUF1043 family)